MSRLHPVFNVVKLTLAPEDPIPNRHSSPPPDPVIINDHEEYEVEQILNSRVFRRQFQYLVKWKGYGAEHNSWEKAADVHAPELIQEYFQLNPGAPRNILAVAFDSINFREFFPDTSRRRILEGGVDVRGNLRARTLSNQPDLSILSYPRPRASMISSDPIISYPRARTSDQIRYHPRNILSYPRTILSPADNNPDWRS